MEILDDYIALPLRLSASWEIKEYATELNNFIKKWYKKDYDLLNKVLPN